ncbi:hypothetical protein MUO93_03880 [Candidatus Bathyarchaeota archaeon]|nr:hypothetical protein [Candidatus Bathyarchaeota archaeon]
MHFEMLEFNPDRPGLQKFMSEAEETVLRCLWEGPREGSDIDRISTYFEGQGSLDPREARRRAKEATESLVARGMLKLSFELKSSGRIVFHPTMNEEDLRRTLVRDIVEKLLAIFPETTKAAIREMNLS